MYVRRNRQLGGLGFAWGLLIPAAASVVSSVIGGSKSSSAPAPAPAPSPQVIVVQQPKEAGLLSGNAPWIIGAGILGVILASKL